MMILSHLALQLVHLGLEFSVEQSSLFVLFFGCCSLSIDGKVILQRIVLFSLLQCQGVPLLHQFMALAL